MWEKVGGCSQICMSLQFPQVVRALPDECVAQVPSLMSLSRALNLVLLLYPQHTGGFWVALSSRKSPTNRGHNKLSKICQLQFSIRSQIGRETGRERYRVELLQDILLEF